MDGGESECVSNGEEKMGSFKEEGHLFFSLLLSCLSCSREIQANLERGEKWMEIREMFSGGR